MRRSEALFIAVLVLTGCCPLKRCPKPMEQRDSVYVAHLVVKEVHDTTVMWKIPEGAASATLPDTDTSKLSTCLAESEAWVKDGKLFHELRNRSGESIPVIVPMPVITVTSQEGRVLERTSTVEVDKPLGWWRKLWLRLGQILSLGILAYIAIKLLRK